MRRSPLILVTAALFVISFIIGAFSVDAGGQR